jgi:hypothetical protein
MNSVYFPALYRASSSYKQLPRQVTDSGQLRTPANFQSKSGKPIQEKRRGDLFAVATKTSMGRLPVSRRKQPGTAFKTASGGALAVRTNFTDRRSRRRVRDANHRHFV